MYLFFYFVNIYVVILVHLILLFAFIVTIQLT